MDFEKRARELAEQMTLEERASQLRFDAPAIERLGIPRYHWWNEALHGLARAGTATMFPQAIGLAAMFDAEEMRRIGDIISTEARAKYNRYSAEEDRDIYKGLTLWSPNVNIFRDPRWGRGQETYGEDPYLTSELAVAFIKGIQGEGKYLKAAACAKHFAVHSGPEELRHEFDAEVSEKDLWETYLPAFEACVKDAHVEGVMGAYNRTNGEPCCAHKRLMQEILRISAEKGWRHSFYGSTQKTLDLLAETLRQRYPGVQIAGMYSPPFREMTPQEDAECVRQINEANPDFVWVGLGAPKQEIWMAAHENRVHGLMIGVGAAFDYEAGNIKRAPKWMQKNTVATNLSTIVISHHRQKLIC